MVYLILDKILDKNVLLSGFDSHFFVVGEIIGLEVIILDEERIYAGSNPVGSGEEPA